MKSCMSVSDFTPTAQGATDGFSAGERVGLMLEGPLVALDKAQGGQDAGRGEADRGWGPAEKMVAWVRWRQWEKTKIWEQIQAIKSLQIDGDRERNDPGLAQLGKVISWAEEGSGHHTC